MPADAINTYKKFEKKQCNIKHNRDLVCGYIVKAYLTDIETKKVLTEEEALIKAVSTWPKDIKPIVHYSESKALHENDTKQKPQAHSDYINSLPNTYGLDVDIMVEAKAKELAILPFINK